MMRPGMLGPWPLALTDHKSVVMDVCDHLKDKDSERGLTGEHYDSRNAEYRPKSTAKHDSDRVVLEHLVAPQPLLPTAQPVLLNLPSVPEPLEMVVHREPVDR